MFQSLASRAALVAALTLGGLSPEVEAQKLGIHFGSHGSSKHFGLHVGFGNKQRHHGYEIVRERVWVPGCTRTVWREAAYATRYDSCGRPYRVCVRPAGYVTVRDPGHWEWRERKVRRGHGRHGYGRRSGYGGYGGRRICR